MLVGSTVLHRPVFLNKFININFKEKKGKQYRKFYSFTILLITILLEHCLLVSDRFNDRWVRTWATRDQKVSVPKHNLVPGGLS